MGIIKISKYLRVSTFFFVLAAAACFGGYLSFFLIAYASAALHEGAHIAAARAFKIPVSRVDILPFGITAQMRDVYIKKPMRECVIALAGPAVNLALAGICWAGMSLFVGGTSEAPSPTMQYIIYVNLGMAALNLLPCLPLDGGRVLKAIFTMRFGFIKAYNFVMTVTRVMISALLCFAIAVLLTARFNFSLILIACFLIGNLTNEQKNVNAVAIRELVKNKEKLMKSDINRVRSIAVFEDAPARLLLRCFSYNYYYVINVIDANDKITKILTETQVINRLLSDSIRIRVGDV